MRSATTPTLTACTGLLVAAAGWYAAILQLPKAPALSENDPSTTTSSETTDETPSLDRGAFDIVLWHTPPPPPEPPKPEETRTAAAAPPPSLQLLAITRLQTGYEAVFYDTRADRLLTLRPGDSFAGYKVATLDATSIKLIQPGRGTIAMNLDQPRIAARAPETPEADND